MEEFFFEICCENETRKISISLRAALGLFIICMSGAWVCLCMCFKGEGWGNRVMIKLTWFPMPSSVIAPSTHWQLLVSQFSINLYIYMYERLLLGLRLKVLYCDLSLKTFCTCSKGCVVWYFNLSWLSLLAQKKEQNKEVLNPLTPRSNL